MLLGVFRGRPCELQSAGGRLSVQYARLPNLELTCFIDAPRCFTQSFMALLFFPAKLLYTAAKFFVFYSVLEHSPVVVFPPFWHTQFLFMLHVSAFYTVWNETFEHSVVVCLFSGFSFLLQDSHSIFKPLDGASEKTLTQYKESLSMHANTDTKRQLLRSHSYFGQCSSVFLTPLKYTLTILFKVSGQGTLRASP